MVQKKVVQFVRADQVFGLLYDFALFVGRQQLRTDRGVDDVEQPPPGDFVVGMRGHPAHQVANEGFRNPAIDSVHRHVVAVVSSPAQRQFGKVAGADHQSARAVGQIH